MHLCVHPRMLLGTTTNGRGTIIDRRRAFKPRGRAEWRWKRVVNWLLDRIVCGLELMSVVVHSCSIISCPKISINKGFAIFFRHHSTQTAYNMLIVDT